MSATILEFPSKVARARAQHARIRDRAADCPRTFALYLPGQRIPGVGHRPRWTGAVPLTGVLRCTLCGKDIIP